MKPLSGIRVLEFTHAVAGPIAGYVLGDMGADVIKVEAPRGRHHRAPADRPPVEGAPDRPYNRVGLFNELNRSKRSVALDVDKEQGRELFLRLVEKADVVLENFSPHVLSNLGLDYDRLREAKPDIILVSMPAFGKTGPYRDRRSYGPGIDAMSGLSHLTGYADGPPLKPGNFYCDQNAGLLAAYGALAAVWHHRATGEGQAIHVAMIEGELQLVADALFDYQFNNREQTRIGNRHATMAPHGVFPCEGVDQYVAIACRNDDDFAALCRVISRDDLADDERFVDLVQRKRNEDELDREITTWTRQRSHYQAMHELQAARVPAGAVLNVAELMDDPHVKARGQFEVAIHPELGPHPHTRVAWRLQGTPSPVDTAAPLYGEHNDVILGDVLGLSEDEIETLVAERIVYREPGQ